jgi:uncharacterized protein YutE (UPF0331/DUF86 family)
MVDHSLIRRKISRLAEYIADLEEQRSISLAEWESNKMLRNYIERTLHKAVEACLDIGKHMIVGLGLRTPEDYKDVMIILAEAGILPREKLNQFKKMAQFRSVIVHDYEDIDPVIIISILRNDLNDLRLFARAIRDKIAG